MNTLILIVGIIVLIFGPLGIVILVSRHAQQARVFKKRAVEEELHAWLESIGLKETAFYFTPTGIRYLTIWSIGITRASSILN